MTLTMARRFGGRGLTAAALFFAAACSPTVKVQPPDKPIEINMNIKIQQEVVIRIDRALEQTFNQNPELFGLPSTPGARK